MKQLALVSIFTLTMLHHMNAQNKKSQDQKAIKSMCGCYEVSFNFAETFQYSKDSTYQASTVKHDGALEWVELLEDADNKIVMQHLLIVGPTNRQHVIKHWRQDWLFENTNLYTYNADNKWNYVSLPKAQVEGQWTQKVFQVDDSPRYEGSATWIHADGKSYWENTTDAPLPRREYTKRSDYNVTVRTNKHEITKTGWIHDQDNDKVIRKEGMNDVILAQEKGLNIYTKVDDNKCKVAQDWWKTNHEPWKLVRNKWETIFNKKANLSLEEKVEDKALYTHLFSKDFSNKEEDINNIIDAFVKKP
ncbi:DUF6607 family protein [Mariniflexile litorale]|uniref:DUF6607 family protein n=1 Tax=Mariniflexile litorale TaxID=3045158 RepID=A0AAU7EL39_9FLAO|nr:DUF6607 family protein [Mariniflexile sp. KMM 9835]MDQ8213230.1 hypothetical protein [Mariniflexile sp. KMM 9835]